MPTVTCNDVVSQKINKKGTFRLFHKCEVQHSYGGTKYILSEVPDPGTGIQTVNTENTKTYLNIWEIIITNSTFVHLIKICGNGVKIQYSVNHGFVCHHVSLKKSFACILLNF